MMQPSSLQVHSSSRNRKKAGSRGQGDAASSLMLAPKMVQNEGQHLWRPPKGPTSPDDHKLQRLQPAQNLLLSCGGWLSRPPFFSQTQKVFCRLHQDPRRHSAPPSVRGVSEETH